MFSAFRRCLSIPHSNFLLFCFCLFVRCVRCVRIADFRNSSFGSRSSRFELLCPILDVRFWMFYVLRCSMILACVRGSSWTLDFRCSILDAWLSLMFIDYPQCSLMFIDLSIFDSCCPSIDLSVALIRRFSFISKWGNSRSMFDSRCSILDVEMCCFWAFHSSLFDLRLFEVSLFEFKLSDFRIVDVSSSDGLDVLCFDCWRVDPRFLLFCMFLLLKTFYRVTGTYQTKGF